MNYSETYEVRKWDAGEWLSLGTFDTESDAGATMDSFAGSAPGSWCVIRTTEVTLRSVVRAK